MTAPTLDDLRALARSSPWLWRTLRFTLQTRGRQPYGTDRLRAWVSRPHGLRVEDVDGRLIEAVWGPRPDEGMAELTDGPTRRPDGLVARRPEDWNLPFRYDDPMFATYQWVAMLHPFELADGVDRDGDGRPDGRWSPTVPPIDVVDGPREVDHHGRPAWEAELVTTPAYAARCSCCPLLDGDQAAQNLAAEGWVRASVGRPTSWRLRLDRRTGVVVRLDQLGGTGADGWTMRIEAVDEPMPRSLFGPARGGGRSSATVVSSRP